MKFLQLILVFIIVGRSTSVCAQTTVHIHSPESLGVVAKGWKTVFLAGTIDMGSAVDWQKQVEDYLDTYRVVTFNPRRPDWDKSWKSEKSDPHFNEQVNWELNALKKSDYIIMNILPGSQSPVSLLELGLYARSKKVMVVCPSGYYRKGNVDIVCEKYNISQYASLNILLQEFIKKLKTR